MGGDRVQGRVFGEVADDYDRLRPGYPDELIDDVVAYGGTADPSVLEVGAGTGKATVALAERGLAVTALEPDRAMAQVLAARCAGLPVRVVASTFEDHRPDRRYDLLVSATAFHWTAPATRWPLSAAALQPRGALALFWNNDRVGDVARERAVRAVVRRLPDDAAAAMTPQARAAWTAYCGHLDRLSEDADPVESAVPDAAWPPSELPTRPEFADLTRRVYRWRRSLTLTDFLAYLLTQSPYRLLPEPVRTRLLGALADVVGDPVPLDVRSVLFLARRADRAG